ncbi:hypothetical protein BDY24DRAFT_414022 [Mrakia frigida]|uniref:uncharacterized protein n=1 Tax=Mrakia frigida TaxID=29902 RepID=UPI003FCC010C
MTSTLLYRQLPSQMSMFNQGPSSFLHQKRAHSPPPSSTRDADSSSSSDSDTPPPPRKRRTTATSSEEEGKQPLFAFQPPAAGPSRGGKRAHDDSEEDEDEEEEVGRRIEDDEDDFPASTSGPSWRSITTTTTTSFPPNPKRFKRTLSDGFLKMSVSEGRGGEGAGFEEEQQEEVVHPYTVEQPEEVGPAVWLGSAPASRDDEVEISGVGEEEEERARNEMAVGFWRGGDSRSSEGAGSSKDPSSLYLPSSYLAQPSTHHLPPPSKAWLNQQRGVVSLYAPPPSFNAPFPTPNPTNSHSTPPPGFGYLPRRPFFGSRTSSTGEMQLDEDEDDAQRSRESEMEEPWTGASITELPDEEEMDLGGEMDVD